MTSILRLALYFFMLLWSVFLVMYTGMFFLFSQADLRDIHVMFPPLSYISSFLGTYDIEPESIPAYEEKRRIGSAIGQFVEWKQQGVGGGGELLQFNDPRTEIELYSPIWDLEGTVHSGAQYLEVAFSHRGRDVAKTYRIFPQGEGDMLSWSYDVSLGKENLFQGQNIYIVRATFADGKVVEKKITLNVNYQRFNVGSSVLYIDPSYVTPDDRGQLVREAVNLDREVVSFVSWGCDTEQPVGDLLIQQGFQYKTIPACATFVEDEYILRFEYQGKENETYLYDIVSPQQGVIYRKFKLIEYVLNTSYMNLVFWDNAKGWLQILQAAGDELSYAIHITLHDPQSQRDVINIVHTDGNQLMVKNQKERMYVYLYKERSNYKALAFPGLRYKFYYNNRLSNQGSMYTLPIRIYAPAQQDKTSTYRFSIELDNDWIIIRDGIKESRFNIFSIGNTISVKDVEPALDQPDACENTNIEIFQNTSGKIATNGHHKDTLRLVGDNLFSSGIEIYHNKNKRPLSPEQIYNGWFHLRLNTEKNNLEPGENTYKIVGYSKGGRKLCEKEIEIVVE